MMKNLKNNLLHFSRAWNKETNLSPTLDWNSNLTPSDFAVLGDLKLFRIA